MKKKERIDKLLVDKGFVKSRERAKRLVLSGIVKVDGLIADKVGHSYDVDSLISITESKREFVSRGGEKLFHALDFFEINPISKSCLDVGSSTGGFTDVLLKREAAHVVCIDVGKGLLDWSLRNDSRVTIIEGFNARYLNREILDSSESNQNFELAVIDVSFISLMKILPVIHKLISFPNEIVALVKPQFEVGKNRVGKGGIVRDHKLHKEVLLNILKESTDLGISPCNVTDSPILGTKGNREFFIHFHMENSKKDFKDVIENIFKI